ncbi:MAG: pallilysin-related adhesin [Spirochaetota bacterium]
MKRIVTLLFFLVSALALAFVGWYWWKSNAERADAAKPVSTRNLVVNHEEGGTAGEDVGKPVTGNLNRIGALPDEVVISAESQNLDQDEGEEQILIVKKTGVKPNGLAVVIADWLPERKLWIRSWESPIPVTKLTTLQLQVRDILGDHRLCIVIAGMNEINEQTLTLFRPRMGSELTGLAYTPIVSLAADSVFIEATERPESYQLAQSNGSPFRILSFTRDRESGNPLDQVRTTWTWDGSGNAYAGSAIDRIPGAQVEQEIANKVLTGRASDFEDFLQGLWYDADSGPRDPKARLLVFDRKGASIIFFSGDSQEVFHWNESHSTRTGLYIGTQNESVQTLKRLLDIEMTGAESVSVRVFEDLLMKIDSENRWDGTYRRLTAGKTAPVKRAAPSALTGAWQSSGVKLGFSEGLYSLELDSSTSSGRYIQYKVGTDQVVELIAGTGGQRIHYEIELKDNKDGSRHLTLTPVVPTINGLERKESGSLDLSQKKQP